MMPSLKNAGKKLRKRIEKHVSPSRRPKRKNRPASESAVLPCREYEEPTISLHSHDDLDSAQFCKSSKIENSFVNSTENEPVKHVPIIKSASKTDIKEQNRMKKLRSSSVTLQSIENTKSLKRKLEEPDEPPVTFSEPKPRKRKLTSQRNSANLEESYIKVQKLDEFETVSLASTDSCFKREDSIRRSLKERLRRMASLGAIFSSPKNYKPVKRCSSLKHDETPPGPAKTKIKKYVQLPTPVKRRTSKLWLDTVADFNSDIKQCMTTQQIRRQEAIFELYSGEKDLVEDLTLVTEVYLNPISKLNLLNEEELQMMFGSIKDLLLLHKELFEKLKEKRNEDGSVDEIGQVLINWIPSLRPYVPYCAQQITRKDLLDNKFKEDPAFADFLQRCLESPFSRKLDLWSFLDAPRSRLVKYPLLFSTIEKLTFDSHSDKVLLHDAIKGIEEIISEADKETGRLKCEFFKNKLYFVNEEHSKFVESAKRLICDGCLRNRNGTKLQAFLFDTVFILTRPATRRGTLMYQVSIEPIALLNINFEDVPDGESRKSGSFKNSLSKGTSDRNLFRVSTRDPDHPKFYSLQAHDDHDKKQWLNSFRTLLPSEKNEACTSL